MKKKHDITDKRTKHKHLAWAKCFTRFSISSKRSVTVHGRHFYLFCMNTFLLILSFLFFIVVVIITGRCQCRGHASTCTPRDGLGCDCQNNTIVPHHCSMSNSFKSTECYKSQVGDVLYIQTVLWRKGKNLDLPFFNSTIRKSFKQSHPSFIYYNLKITWWSHCHPILLVLFILTTTKFAV